MAETKEKVVPVAKATNGAEITSDLSLGGKQVSREEAAKMLMEMTVGEKDSGYLEFEPGEEKRVVFLGFSQINGMGDKKGTMVPAARFVTESGKEQINADAAVVSYFEKQSAGVARLVRCVGTTNSKTTGFEYKKFDFFELNVKK